jgi:2-dehydropantoate 2-reductase
VRAAENATDIGPVDAVLVTVKAPALPAVAAGIGPLLGPDTPVAFIMNGIPWWYFDGIGGALEGKRLPLLDLDDALRRAVGVKRAIGGVIYAASAVAAPGIVTSEHADLKLFLGEPGGVVSPRAQALAALLSAGGMPTEAVGNIRHRLWGKLLGNMVVGPLCLLSRQDMQATLADPAIFEAGVRISDEGTALARALGHDLKVPGEVRMRRFAETAHKPSILQDLELGRPMEIDALFTAPLQLGQALGVPMPNFALMVALASQAARAAGLYR